MIVQGYLRAALLGFSSSSPNDFCVVNVPNEERFNMSFTAGGLFQPESLRIASMFCEVRDWNFVRQKVISENLLQARTLATSQRIYREVFSRLQTLDPMEMEWLIHGPAQDQVHILWLAVCRRYRFIADFAVEVLRERYLSLKSDLQYEDFDFFFNMKAAWHPELESIKPSTRNKLRQVLFRMLREANLLTADNAINGAILSQQLLDTLVRKECREFSLFPMFDSATKGRPE